MPDDDLRSRSPRLGADLTETEYRIYVAASSVTCGLLLILFAWGGVEIKIKSRDVLGWAQLTGAMAGFGIAILALLNDQGRSQRRLRMLVAAAAISLTFATLGSAIIFLKSPDSELSAKIAFVIGAGFFLAFGLGKLVVPTRAAWKYKHLHDIVGEPFLMSPLLVVALWPTANPLLAYTIILSISGLTAASAAVAAFTWMLVRPRIAMSAIEQGILRALQARRQNAQLTGRVSLATFKELRDEMFSNEENIRASLDSLVAQDAIIRISADQYWLLDSADLNSCLNYVGTKTFFIFPAIHTLGDLVAADLRRATGVPEEVISRYFEKALLRKIKDGRQAIELEGYVMVAAVPTVPQIAKSVGPHVREKIRSGVAVSEGDLARDALRGAACLPDFDNLGDAVLNSIGAYIAKSEPFYLSCADYDGTEDFRREILSATIVLESPDLLARSASKRGLPNSTNALFFGQFMERMFTPIVDSRLESLYKINKMWVKSDQEQALKEIYSDLVLKYDKYFDVYVSGRYAQYNAEEDARAWAIENKAKQFLARHPNPVSLQNELMAAINALKVPMSPPPNDRLRVDVLIAFLFYLGEAKRRSLVAGADSISNKS